MTLGSYIFSLHKKALKSLASYACSLWLAVVFLMFGYMLFFRKKKEKIPVHLGFTLNSWSCSSGRSKRLSLGYSPLCMRVKSLQSCLTVSDPMDCIAHQAPLSMGFSKQDCWSGLSCPPPGDLPRPGIEPSSHVSCISRRALYHWCRLKSPQSSVRTPNQTSLTTFTSCAFYSVDRQVLPGGIMGQLNIRDVWKEQIVRVGEKKNYGLSANV